jgi:hypothetical protein
VPPAITVPLTAQPVGRGVCNDAVRDPPAIASTIARVSGAGRVDCARISVQLERDEAEFAFPLDLQNHRAVRFERVQDRSQAG